MSDNHTAAFPSPAISQNAATGETTTHQSEAGMSLRDYFAAKTLVGMYASGEVARGLSRQDVNLTDQAHCAAAAEWSYLQADEMMKAREL